MEQSIKKTLIGFYFRNKREKTPGVDKMKKQESSSSIPSSKKHQAPQLPTIEKTVFFLPGVDVKVLLIISLIFKKEIYVYLIYVYLIFLFLL